MSINDDARRIGAEVARRVVDVGIDFEHDHTTTEFWLEDGELSVIAQHKYMDSHMAVMTMDQARKLRDWLNENVKD